MSLAHNDYDDFCGDSNERDEAIDKIMKEIWHEIATDAKFREKLFIDYDICANDFLHAYAIRNAFSKSNINSGEWLASSNVIHAIITQIEGAVKHIAEKRYELRG